MKFDKEKILNSIKEPRNIVIISSCLVATGLVISPIAIIFSKVNFFNRTQYIPVLKSKVEMNGDLREVFGDLNHSINQVKTNINAIVTNNKNLFLSNYEYLDKSVFESTNFLCDLAFKNNVDNWENWGNKNFSQWENGQNVSRHLFNGFNNYNAPIKFSSKGQLYSTINGNLKEIAINAGIASTNQIVSIASADFGIDNKNNVLIPLEVKDNSSSITSVKKILVIQPSDFTIDMYLNIIMRFDGGNRPIEKEVNLIYKPNSYSF